MESKEARGENNRSISPSNEERCGDSGRRSAPEKTGAWRVTNVYSGAIAAPIFLASWFFAFYNRAIGKA